MFLSVQAITFEPLDIETSFLVCRYILTISHLSIKVIGSRSRSYEKNACFIYFNLLILCMLQQVITKVKVTHEGEGHIKVKVKISSSLQTLCKILLILTYYVCGYRSSIRSMSHMKVKVTSSSSKLSTSLQILCNPYSLQADGLHSTEMLLVLTYHFVLKRNH